METERTSQNAILFIHGILGTPEHFRSFLPLVPAGWTVRSLTLRGHCGEVTEMAKASMAQWKAQVHEALSELRAEHETVFIAAHSMGTLFAIEEAVAEPVTALFLLNVPLKIHVTRRLAQICWMIYRDKADLSDPSDAAIRSAYGFAPDRNIFHYAGWIPRYLELFGEIRRTNNLLERLRVPCFAYLSANDEMVSPRAGDLLRERTRTEVKVLPRSGHFYYEPEDEALLLRDFRQKIVHSAEK